MPAQHPLYELNKEFSAAMWHLEERESGNEETRPILYHYTTAEGLWGIVESGQIFASHILYQNDRSELVNALEVFEEEFESATMDLNKNLKHVMSCLVPSMLADAFTFAYFVVSFCEDGNLLSQWRAYGGSGSGYSIGFDKRILETAPLGIDLGIRVRKVIYDKSAKRSLLRTRLEMLSTIVSSHAGLIEKTWDEDSRIVLSFWKQVLTDFQPSLVLMKHDAFSEEREWRLIRKTLVSGRKNGIKVRVISGRLTPYVPVRWSLKTNGESTGLETVICGPSDEAKLKAEATRIFLDSKGWASTSVTDSAVPLRHR
jgi:Protein of unknown function (DUF2971)